MIFSWVIVTETQMITACKKIVCNKDYNYVLNIGVLHRSPFIVKNLQAILFSHGMNESTRDYINDNLLIAIEAGLGLRFLARIKESGYGYVNNPAPRYKDCVKINYVGAIQENDHLSYIIQVKNITVLLSVHLVLSSLILFYFVGHWIYRVAAIITSRCLSK